MLVTNRGVYRYHFCCHRPSCIVEQHEFSILCQQLALPPAVEGGLMFASVSYFIYLFINDFCHTNYLNIYPTDRRQIFRIGR